MKQKSKWRRGACILVYLSLAVVTVGAQTKLPEGEGRIAIERTCVKCHKIDEVVRTRRTEEQWAEVIETMISRGAQGTDRELEQVYRYLVTNFLKEKAPQKVNVNKATSKEIAATLELSAGDADAIVHYREKNGAFKELDDLKKVPSIDMKRIGDYKDRLEF